MNDEFGLQDAKRLVGLFDALQESKEAAFETKLEFHLNRVPVPDLDCKFYFKTVCQFPENEWFYPTNEGGSDFAVSNDLYAWNLIQKTSLPVWTDNGFRGLRTYFRYNLNLEYSEAV